MRGLLQLALLLAFGVLVVSAGVAVQAKGDANAGKIKYESFCVGCHGTAGKGDGSAAAALNPRPADLSDPAYTKTLSDQYLFDAIKGGGPKVKKSPLMPAWGGALNDNDIWNVVAYLRSLPLAKTAK